MLTQEQEVDNKSKKQEAQENNIQLIVASSNTTKPFDPAEKTLDLVPSLVKLCAQAPKRRGVLKRGILHHTARVSSRCSWAERPAPTHILPQDDVSPLHNRPYPSTICIPALATPSAALSTCGLPDRHEHCRARDEKSTDNRDPRQPDESWWSILHETCR